MQGKTKRAMPRILVAALISGAVFAAAAWWLYGSLLHGLIGGDWMVYHAAARAALEGQDGILYDAHAFTVALNAHFAGQLAEPYHLHPWLYPPSYLLILIPFAMLPFWTGYAAFLTFSLALMAGSLACGARTRDEATFFILAALLAPASAIVIAIGQNSFLTAALMIGGLTQIRARPLLAGVLFGLLAYKPQFCLMIPVALIAMRQWRTLAAAALTGLGLAGASAAIFGVELWTGWLHLMTMPNDSFAHWQALSRFHGQSLYAYAMALGIPSPIANVVQAMGILLAAAFVWRLYRHPHPEPLRIAGLLVAAMVAAPHVMNYDALLLCIAGAILFAESVRSRLNRFNAAIGILVWLCPLINPPSIFPIALATPLLLVLLATRILAGQKGEEPARLKVSLNPETLPS